MTDTIKKTKNGVTLELVCGPCCGLEVFFINGTETIMQSHKYGIAIYKREDNGKTAFYQRELD
tara:strand:- start:6062 stop:6250 length:189 start_codon:yes stop_codon:yes gene_type:complete